MAILADAVETCPLRLVRAKADGRWKQRQAPKTHYELKCKFFTSSSLWVPAAQNMFWVLLCLMKALIKCIMLISTYLCHAYMCVCVCVRFPVFCPTKRRPHQAAPHSLGKARSTARRQQKRSILLSLAHRAQTNRPNWRHDKKAKRIAG